MRKPAPRGPSIRLLLLVVVSASGAGAACAPAPTTETDGAQTAPDVASPSGWWRPAPGTTWQWQLRETLVTSLDVAMYDVDLFDAPAGTIASLQAAGRVVVCYFSAGSYEDWRSDAARFAPADYGSPLEGWPGEWWLDVRSENVRGIMRTRLDEAVAKGCDAVEPDNVDGYANESGFPLTEADQLDFNRFLAAEAHARGLSVGLKNALDLVPELEQSFDWALNEECLSFGECGALRPFLDAGKAVFHVEYVDERTEGPARRDAVCPEPSRAGFSTLVKTWELDAWGLACD